LARSVVHLLRRDRVLLEQLLGALEIRLRLFVLGVGPFGVGADLAVVEMRELRALLHRLAFGEAQFLSTALSLLTTSICSSEAMPPSRGTGHDGARLNAAPDRRRHLKADARPCRRKLAASSEENCDCDAWGGRFMAGPYPHASRHRPRLLERPLRARDVRPVRVGERENFGNRAGGSAGEEEPLTSQWCPPRSRPLNPPRSRGAPRPERCDPGQGRATASTSPAAPADAD
jgi:hypothetical protein